MKTIVLLKEVLKDALPNDVIYYISKFCNKKIKYKKLYQYKSYKNDQKKIKFKYHYYYH